MATKVSNIRGALVAAISLSAVTATAADLSVRVLDRGGEPVPDVAVYVESPALSASATTNDAHAVMDQYDRRFVPHLLVVRTGTPVEFPNSDEIAHHVYSFSHPNQFKLPIYKGDAYPPLTFDESGLVILGCNIHDNMLGYILVVDTPVFAKTDESGRASFELDEAGRVSVWSPRIRDDVESLSVDIDPTQGDGELVVRLQKSLRPAHDQRTESLTWSDY